jgi:hypothetical protein
MELMIRTELFEEPQICGSRTGYDHIAFSLDWTFLRLIYLRQIFFVRLPSKIEENMNFDYMHFEMANLSKRKFKNCRLILLFLQKEMPDTDQGSKFRIITEKIFSLSTCLP